MRIWRTRKGSSTETTLPQPITTSTAASPTASAMGTFSQPPVSAATPSVAARPAIPAIMPTARFLPQKISSGRTGSKKSVCAPARS